VFFALVGASIKALPPKLIMEGLAGSLLIALIVLGSLTVRTFHRFYDLSIPWHQLIPSWLAAIALGLLAVSVRWLQSFPVGLVEMCCLESGLALLYLVILAKLGSPWVRYLRDRGFDVLAPWAKNLRMLRTAYE
jgi:hypothetical protein